jgi:hypothetical protein
MKKLALLAGCVCLLGLSGLWAQDKFYTKEGRIYFNATGDMEKIEATNKTAICVLDIKTGALQFAILLKGFEFEKALMQEHFNENYAESDKFPKSEFRGLVLNNKEISYGKPGIYDVRVKGMLTLHGESKEVTASGKFIIKDGRIQSVADFEILLSDFRIAIPGLVKDKVSNHAKIQVDCSLQPLKN